MMAGIKRKVSDFRGASPAGERRAARLRNCQAITWMVSVGRIANPSVCGRTDWQSVLQPGFNLFLDSSLRRAWRPLEDPFLPESLDESGAIGLAGVTEPGGYLGLDGRLADLPGRIRLLHAADPAVKFVDV